MRARHLAIFSGTPAFERPRCVGSPNLPERSTFHALLDKALNKRWLTNDGILVQEFESRVAELSGVRHCVAVSNATVGLQILFVAMGLKGCVLMPAMTFIATAHAAAWVGLRPIFCDIDPETLCISQDAGFHCDEVCAVLGVHLFGNCSYIQSTKPIIYDAAQAFGCCWDGRQAGSGGLAEVFSFHATKIINCFEGGAVVTNDDALAKDLRRIRNFGFSGMDKVQCLGTNAKMNEASAAMGLSMLDKLSDIMHHDSHLHEKYTAGLDVPGIRLLPKPHGSHYAVVLVGPDCWISRDDLLRVLMAENIVARRYHWPGCHRSEPYCRTAQPFLRNTNSILGRIMQLPMGQAMSTSDVEKVCDIIRSVIYNPWKVREKLL